MQASTALKRLGGETAIYGVATAVMQLGPFVLVPFLAHYFSPEEMGQVTLINAALGLLTGFLILGLDNSSHRWYWQSENDNDRRTTLASWFWFLLLSNVAVALVLLLSTAWWAPYLGQLSTGLAMLVVALIGLKALQTFYLNFLRMARRPYLVLALNAGSMMLLVGATFALLYYGQRGVAGVFEAQLLTLLLLLFPVCWGVRRHVGWRYFSLPRLRSMFRYALPLVPAGILSWLINMADRWYLQDSFGLAVVGQYQLAFSVALLVGLPAMAFQQAWAPFAFSMAKHEAAPRIYAAAMAVCVAIFSVLSVFVALFAGPIVGLVSAKSFAGAELFVWPLAFTQLFLVLYYIAALGANLAMKNGPVAWALVWAAVVKLAAMFVLGHFMGALGVALATLLAHMVMAGFLFWASQRLQPFPYPFLASVIYMGLVLALVAGLRLLSAAQNLPEWGLPLAGLVLALVLTAVYLWRMARALDVIDMVGGRYQRSLKG